MSKIKIILSLIILTSIFSFKIKQENKILGVWEMEIFKINNDTIFNVNDVNSTLKYFFKKNELKDTLSETKTKFEKRCQDEFYKYKQMRIEFNSKFIMSYKIDSKSGKSEINKKIKYQLIDNKIIINEKDKEEFNYQIVFDTNKDIIIIRLENNQLNITNIYTRIEK